MNYFDMITFYNTINMKKSRQVKKKLISLRKEGTNSIFTPFKERDSLSKIPSLPQAKKGLYLFLSKLLRIARQFFCAPPNSSLVMICRMLSLSIDVYIS